MKILVVTGARELASLFVPYLVAETRKKWAHEKIIAHLEGVELVVCGDASGPDVWALQLALARGIPVSTWRLSGLVVLVRKGQPNSERRWATEELKRGQSMSKWPLVRNTHMAMWVGERIRVHHDDVSCIALGHKASRTQGTAQTVRKLLEEGVHPDNIHHFIMED